YINIRYNELDEVVNELEEKKFDENKNEIDEIEPLRKISVIPNLRLLAQWIYYITIISKKKRISVNMRFSNQFCEKKTQYLTKENEGHFSVSVLLKNNIYSRFL
ncbi:hypothetical protein CDIK_4071, partial [Cucumispora dikerogammari]